MKFAKLTTPNGLAVYVHPSMIIEPVLEPHDIRRCTIRTQMGTQDVRETPADVVAALAEID